MAKRAVIAIGGNALISEGQQGTIEDQFVNARAAARQVGALVAAGWQVVITHGNGPQVGFILLRSELFKGEPFIPRLPLDVCVADSEGGIGYILANSLLNELGERGLGQRAVCVVSQTVVAADDPAFQRPTKPIGPSFTAGEAETRRAQDGWAMAEDPPRGYRRLVASPAPLRIVETPAIGALLEAGFIVIAAGGGGIPVVEVQPDVFRGVEAVVDKDLASACLASSLKVPVLVISTSVERVSVRYRQPDQRDLARVSLDELRGYVADGEFPEGSMGPKIRAAIQFLDAGGSEVIITSVSCLEAAVTGEAGTHITAR